MKFSPRTLANLASGALTGPYLAAWIYYGEAVPQRTWVYVALACFLAAALLQQWVYHRLTPPLSTAALPRPELSLQLERVPRVVWLAALPPVVVVAVLWWVTFHGSALPWRDNWLGPPQPAASHRMYLPSVIMLIIFSSLASWKVVYSLARWHGMARSYPFRNERLLRAVVMQWTVMVSLLCGVAGFNFYLPMLPATACAILYGMGLSAIVWWGRWEYQLRQGDPHTGTWWYVDFRDPTFLGPRGLNLANRWSWILAAAGVTPVFLAEWLYQSARG